MLAIFSSTYLLKPSISDTTTITVATPKITPSKVRNERSLCAQMASTASFIDSNIFIAKRSSQCFTNYTLRCSMKQDKYWREIRRMRSGERFQFNSLFIQLRLAGSRPDNEPKPLPVRGFLLLSFFQIRSFDHGQFSHRLRIRRCRDVGDNLDVVQSLNHLAEDGVLAIPIWIGAQADEELARRAVWIVRPRHTDRAAHERSRAEFGGHSRLIRVARPPHSAISTAASLRVAALD